MLTEQVPTAEVPPNEARAIAKEAYIYAYAMLENYHTWYKQAVDRKAPEYVGGFGRFRHYSEPFTPANHDIVPPNNDTPYSWAWRDPRSEPWVLSVPSVPKDLHCVTQWVDLFTYNFAYVGVRATGFDAGNYLFVGPKWPDETPKGIEQIFKAETKIVGTLTQTTLNGPDDVPNLKAIQAQVKRAPLSQFLGTRAPQVAPAIPSPLTTYYQRHGLPPTQHELALALGISQNTVSVMLMRLYQKGLLRRVRSSYLPIDTDVVTGKQAGGQVKGSDPGASA